MWRYLQRHYFIHNAFASRKRTYTETTGYTEEKWLDINTRFDLQVYVINTAKITVIYRTAP